MPAKKKKVQSKKKVSKTRGRNVVLLETSGGRTITLSDNGMKIEIDDGNGNAITISPSGITINAAAKVRVNAAEIVLNAGLMTVNAGTAKFSGAVQCDALVSNSVMSASYSPGVGNVW